MKFICTLFVLSSIYSSTFSQGFIAALDPDDIGVILRSPATVVLQSGDTLNGELRSATLSSNYLKNITLNMKDGSKRKFQAAEMSSLWVKLSSKARLAMVSESASYYFKNFDEVINREYIIFEQALRATKKDKLAMMQLLNPGFDHVVKVYADPNAKETEGLSIEGISLTGGKDKSYLFVKGESKVIIVKKGSYKRNFDDLYGDCKEMMINFEGEKKKFNDMAGHVFVYDQVCGK